MTNYELEKLSKMIASEILKKVGDDDYLLNLVLPPRFLNIEEASEYTRIPVNTLYSKSSEIPHMKVGKRLVFTDRELVRWMTRG